MPDYVEIEDIGEIRRLSNGLIKSLRDELPYSVKRVIGYPQGRFTNTVHFRNRSGENCFWWSTLVSKDGRVIDNFFGHGDPQSGASLNIDVQFNFPVRRFSRTRGGSFLRHIATNKNLLAHRGIVTLGHARVSKNELFSEMMATLREVQVGDGISEILVIGELGSDSLVDDIESFSSELRRVVKSLRGRSVRSTPLSKGERKSEGRQGNQPSLGALRSYFDEFSGKREFKRQSRGIADWHHGEVVRALRDKFAGGAEILKSREIDLIALTASRLFIFEVKTSVEPQAIYTAIGQIAVHTPMIEKRIPGIPVDRVIVLPEKPNARLHKRITNDLDIKVVTFARSKTGRITIDSRSVEPPCI